ncbi:hypothetical protein CCMSSC00406_0008485 [Pleurotus cornucopiae]|uniref:Uncharacterized protein n=1 Tax=Pleurotus cornucopiae TaxID=5321 RepID=A0ACB7IJ42_PLECO|nr:hypothetical protein CCMSSC00406_0008485 [Pleurotus cornucopiae]
MDPTYPAFPIFAFISFVLVLIPLPWHFQAWNSGTCLYMIWIAIGCLNFSINSIIWHGNAIDWAPIWCDISTRLTVGLSVAIPAATLCINRRLYKIASVQCVSISRSEKRRAVMVDLAIGLGIPAVQMALQFVVQGHRYDIWEDIGCLPTTFNTPPAYPLSICWPLAIAFISAIYAGLTLRAFMQRRAQFAQYLAANSSLTANRYFRLMSLAGIELLFNIPINAYGLYLNITASPIYPWRGWADAHFDWYLIDQYPAVLWRMSQRTIVTFELSRWSVVFCALLFFGFFGFADEARRHYRIAYESVANRIGFKMPSLPKTKSFGISFGSWEKKEFVLPISSSAGSIPVFMPKALSPATTHTSLSRHSSSSSTNAFDTTSATISSSPATPHITAGSPDAPTINTSPKRPRPLTTGFFSPVDDSTYSKHFVAL